METLLESRSKFIWKGCGIASDAWWQWLCRLKNVLLPFPGKRRLLKVWGVLETQRILSPSLRGNKNNWLTEKDKLDCIGKYIQVFFKKILLDNWSSSGIAVFFYANEFPSILLKELNANEGKLHRTCTVVINLLHFFNKNLLSLDWGFQSFSAEGKKEKNLICIPNLWCFNY